MTKVKNQEAMAKVREMFKENPWDFNFSIKWILVD